MWCSILLFTFCIYEVFTGPLVLSLVKCWMCPLCFHEVTHPQHTQIHWSGLDWWIQWTLSIRPYVMCVVWPLCWRLPAVSFTAILMIFNLPGLLKAGPRYKNTQCISVSHIFICTDTQKACMEMHTSRVMIWCTYFTLATFIINSSLCAPRGEGSSLINLSF